MNKKLRIATGITAGALLATTLMPVYQLKGESNFVNLFGLFDLAPALVLMIPALCITLIALCVRWHNQQSLLFSPLLGVLILCMLAANGYTNENAVTPEPYTSFTLLSILAGFVLTIMWLVISVKFAVQYRKLPREQRSMNFREGVEQRLAKMDKAQLAKAKKQAHGAAVWWFVAASIFMFPLESYLDPQTFNIEPGLATALRLVLSITMAIVAVYIYRRKPARDQIVKVGSVLAAAAVVPLLFIGQEVKTDGFHSSYLYVAGSALFCLLPILSTRYAQIIDTFKPKK